MSISISARDLRAALNLRKQIDKVESRKNELETRLARLLGGRSEAVTPSRRAGKSTGRKRGRPKGSIRKGSQKQLLLDVLSSAKKALSLKEIVAALKARGMKSKSSDPSRGLAVLLYRDPAFKRAGRGLFTLSGKAARGPATSKKRRKRRARKTKA